MTAKDARGRRNAEAEIVRRCEDIYGLVVDGQPFRAIRQHVAESRFIDWTASDRTLRNYVTRCHKRIVAAAEVDMEATRGRAVERLERLYARATAGGDLRTALAVQQEIHRLHGLNAPTKAELSGPGGVPLPGATTEELAARFDELVRTQRKRLKQKAG
jgi:hypothetical protein